MNAKSNLGRGLSALLGDEISVLSDDKNQDGSDISAKSFGYRKLPIALVFAQKNQPRQSFDENRLQELADSLKNTGMLQPILVRPIAGKEDNFEIIAGERRWRAAQKAGMHEIPVIIRQMDDAETAEIALIENIQREDLNPIEEARGLQKLQEKFSYTQEMLAERIGKSRPAIANSLRLLTLPQSVCDMLENGSMNSGHARTLIGLEAEQIERLAQEISDKKLSVRIVENKVAKLKNGKNASDSAELARNPNIIDQERQLQDMFGIKVEIAEKNKGGKIILHFSDHVQYRQIIEKLTG